jgi:hypothetical protein
MLLGRYAGDARDGDGTRIADGVRFLKRSVHDVLVRPEWAFYGHFYAAWSAWQQDGDDPTDEGASRGRIDPDSKRFWGPWHTLVYRALLDQQRIDGSWHDEDDNFGFPDELPTSLGGSSPSRSPTRRCRSSSADCLPAATGVAAGGGRVPDLAFPPREDRETERDPAGPSGTQRTRRDPDVNRDPGYARPGASRLPSGPQQVVPCSRASRPLRARRDRRASGTGGCWRVRRRTQRLVHAPERNPSTSTAT